LADYAEACDARYNIGMLDENSLDEKSETLAAESLLPCCGLTSARLIINSMTAPTNATIENSHPNIEDSSVPLLAGE
jgi:hypothetical protein